MHAEGVEAVIIVEDLLEPDGADIATRTGDQTDDQGTLWVHKARSRGDGHQTSNRTRGQTQHAGLLALNPLHDHPRQGRSSSSDLGVQHGSRGDAVSGPFRTGVEAEPAHPQKRGTDHRIDEVVRRHVLRAVTLTLAQNQGADQASNTGIDVNHGAARKVEHASGREEAAAPDPVTDRRIDEDRPQGREDQQRRELHTLGEGTGNQGWGDDREGHLIGDPQHFRQPLGHCVGCVDPHIVQEEGIKAADIGLQGRRWVVAQGEAVGADHPHDRHQSGNGEGLGDRGNDVLLTHHAAVKQGKARNGHQQDESGGGQDPSRSAGVQLERGLVSQQGGGGRSGLLGSGSRRGGQGRFGRISGRR